MVAHLAAWACFFRLDTLEVMQAVSILLNGQWDLLSQFNRFLPSGYHIETLPSSLAAYTGCYNMSMPNPGLSKALATSFVGRVVVRSCACHAHKSSAKTVFCPLVVFQERFSCDPQLLIRFQQGLEASSPDDNLQNSARSKEPAGIMQVDEAARCVMHSEFTVIKTCFWQVLQMMRPLLDKEPDLLQEFMQYVPASCTTTGHVHVIAPP